MDLQHLTPRKKEEFLLDLSSKEEPGTLFDGFNILTWACWEKLQRVLRVLLKDQGADPNIKNIDGTTALTWAPAAEYTKLLIVYGARVHFEEPNDREYSVHYASKNGRRDQVELLMSRGEGRRFIEFFNEFGETPLSLAANRGHIDVVKYLLELGADPNAFDQNIVCNTVLQNAISGGNETIVTLLLEKGSRVETHGFNPTPWDMASHQRLSDELLSRLVNCEINPVRP